MVTSMTRLHITPFNSDLVPVILGPQISKLATDISFHSLQTFPDQDYGYVDLPAMEAEKIKKKLNGAILKGKKVKVEEARPRKRKHTEDDAINHQVEPTSESPPPKKQKSKKDRNIVEGHELPTDRKVKRGWTETKVTSAAKKKDRVKSSTKPQSTSKYSEKEEMLFKTILPDNKASQQNGDSKRKKKQKTKDGAEVVHEFENATAIPSFLRNSVVDGQKTVSYEDGQGWVDENGEMVEKEDRKALRRRKAAQHGVELEVIETQLPKVIKLDPISVSEDVVHDSESASPKDTDVSDSDESSTSYHSAEIEPATDDETSSSGSSTTDQTSEESSDDSQDLSTGEEAISTVTTPPPSSVHPLEALFKKPIKPASSQNTTISQDVIKPSLEVQTSFSFFEREDNDNLPIMPMTPFSSQDLRSRELRSAAPTPDTAHPSRMSSIFNGEESEGELSDMPDNMDGEAALTGRQQSPANHNLQVPQTDFEKQFWERRGENNRAWKARRRAVLKEQRQRENRSRRPKNW